MTVSDAEIDAAQRALAAEHAALWAYGVLGPRSGSRSALARDAFGSHREARDSLTSWLVSVGVDPVTTRPGYQLPFPLAGAADAAALARRLEDGCGNAYATLTATTAVPALRALATAQLDDCAGRRVAWGATPQTFPGLPGQK